MRKSTKYSLLSLLFIFFVIPLHLHAEEVTDEELLLFEDEAKVSLGHELYHFPEVKPHVELGLGYRFVRPTGSKRAMEYTDYNDSILVHGEGRAFSYPHRQYLNFDFVTSEDHFADLRYAYGENQLFLRWINTSLFHNLDAAAYSTANNDGGYTFDPRDPDVEYGVQNNRNKLFLRWKAHDFPLHAYFDGHHVSREGTTQQKTALGGALFGNITLTSQSRDVDQATSIYTIGTNSHLGPVEVDFSHKRKHFDVSKGQVLIDYYDPSGSRTGGFYPHNQYPELKGTINTLKIHSSYSGQVVATATFSQNKRENETSGAKSEALAGSGAVLWMPRTDLSFNIKFSHRDLDVENPSQVTMTNLTDLTSVTYNPKSSISTTKNSITLSGKYKPALSTTLRAKYFYTEAKRTNAELWHLQESTRDHKLSFTADARLAKDITARAKYQYRYVSSPAYNVEPDSAHQGDANITWVPTPRFNMLLSYRISRQKRDELHFSDTSVPLDTRPENREIDSNDFMASGTFQVRPNLSLSLSYLFLQYKITQDIYSHTGAGAPQVDYGVVYEDKAHVYTLAVHYQATDKLMGSAEITHTRNNGGFTPGEDFHLQPVSIATFSNQEVRDTYFRLTGEYLLRTDLTLGLQYSYADFDDVLDNVYDSESDGRGHLILFNISKKW
jgi:hypothetical protein